MSVVQVIVADVWVIEELATPEMTGAGVEMGIATLKLIAKSLVLALPAPSMQRT
ncbi:Uncharacterised protein [uncultured archaeon]|nr:Uncharacterised protein [uncultured archaeon]